jgi:hypothetical protein
MITQLKINPKMREELKRDGFADEQIPDWVADLQPDHSRPASCS